MKDGTVKAGTMKAGAMKVGIVKDGTVKEGAVKDGTVKDGTVKAGTTKAGAMKAGAMKVGTVKEGTVKEGTVPSIAKIRIDLTTEAGELNLKLLMLDSVSNCLQHGCSNCSGLESKVDLRAHFRVSVELKKTCEPCGALICTSFRVENDG